MALFVVMVVVLVLSVLIFQLTFTTKVEERISHHRRGFQELTYTLQAVARGAMLKLYTDWQDDQAEGDPAGAGGGGQEGGGGGGGMGGEGGGGGGAGAGGGLGGLAGAAAEQGIDSRHEDWAHRYNENLNEVSTDVLIHDGEGRIGLNDLFGYIKLDDEDADDEGDGEGGEEGGPPDPGGSEGGTVGGEQGDDSEGEEEEEEEPEEEEYTPPSHEHVEATRAMVSRLVEAVIHFNQEAGFSYDDLPNPDVVADAIVDGVLFRQREEETRTIRSIEWLKDLEEVTWEVFNGPYDPSEDEEEEDREAGLDDMGEDPLGDLFGSMGLGGFEVLEEGVEEIPRPVGLRHVLTAYSTGRINLNTARPEVLIALLQSFDDFDEAVDIALQIDDFRNSFVEESEEEEEGGEEQDEEDPDPDEGEVEEMPEFNVFRSVADLQQVNEEWSEDQFDEESVFSLLKHDLEPVAAFRSSYFTAHLQGERGEHTLDGELVLVRMQGKIVVISWREITP
ncbi:MAG: hypothetical protein ACE5GW_08745 [Planctomycetota bacterium]